MPAMRIDQNDDEVDRQWQRNEAELRRLYALPGLKREISGARIEALEAEHDRLEYEAGLPANHRPGMRRWSGMRDWRQKGSLCPAPDSTFSIAAFFRRG